MTRTHRVVVVDDSALIRQTISDALKTIPGVEIVATAATGPEALDVVARHRPDVVSLDVELPGMNGLEVLAKLMKTNPTRVVLVSAHTTHGAEMTIEGLELGALDFLLKPSVSEGIDGFRIRLRRTFRAALSAKIPTKTGAGLPPSAPTVAATPLRPTALAVVASSTGGPQALYTLFATITKKPNYPMAVVQHMPAGFTAKLAERLNRAGAMSVSEARDGDELVAGHAYVAPGNSHLEIHGTRVQLTDADPIGGLRPRADVALSTASADYGNRLTAVVMTGMGADGLVGCRVVKRAGGQVIAQDGPSSTVDGMPRVIRTDGLADAIGTPEEIALTLQATPAQLNLMKPGRR